MKERRGDYKMSSLPPFLHEGDPGVHSGIQDHSVLVTRSALWQDVKNRVIIKPLHELAATNNTMTQDLSNISGEHLCPANRGENTFSQAAVLTVVVHQIISSKELRFFFLLLTAVVTYQPSIATKTRRLKKQGTEKLCRYSYNKILPASRYNFKATATDGTANGQFTFFTPAGDEATGHPCSELAQKKDPRETPTEILSIKCQKHLFQVHFSSFTRKGSGTPPHDIIHVVAQTIVTAMATQKNETAGSESPEKKPTPAKRPLLPQASSEAKKKKGD
nr:hypothetical protein [Tanacetum cinerariifolium]